MSVISVTVVILRTWRKPVGITSATNIFTLNVSVLLMGMNQKQAHVPQPKV